MYCPEKEYAHGFKQKTDSWCSGGGECTGLNGIGSDLIYLFKKQNSHFDCFQSSCAPLVDRIIMFQRLENTKGLLGNGTMNDCVHLRGS